jgi:NADPH:quinone reductase-like Zn-dependent oxidoreductase
VRQGLFWTEMPYPKVLGVEGAGRVRAVGEGVDAIRPGERVAWVYAPGSYAGHVIAPAAALVPLPDAIQSEASRARLRTHPAPGPGEALVAVDAVSLNYRDNLIMANRLGAEPPLPLVPASDMAGVALMLARIVGVNA